MAQIGAVLKAEISRVARKEVKTALRPLQQASSRYRSEIAALKRDMDALRRSYGRLTKAAAKQGESAELEEEEPRLRFRAAGFAALRTKLGLSAAEMGKLIGVTQQSIYHWESGKSRPRASQLEAISKARKLGKRGAAQVLASL